VSYGHFTEFLAYDRIYKKNRNKQFPLENFPGSRSHSPYYILEASTPTDEFFLRDGINKNGQYLEFLRERRGFCQRIISEEKHSFELNFGNIIRTMRSTTGEISKWKLFVSVFLIKPCHRLKIQ
jgi:hypothetical protein